MKVQIIIHTKEKQIPIKSTEQIIEIIETQTYNLYEYNNQEVYDYEPFIETEQKEPKTRKIIAETLSEIASIKETYVQIKENNITVEIRILSEKDIEYILNTISDKDINFAKERSIEYLEQLTT